MEPKETSTQHVHATPGVVGASHSYRDPAPAAPFCRPFHVLAMEIELPGHVQAVTRQDSHARPEFLRGEAPAAGLVRAKRILPLLDRFALDHYMLKSESV